MAKIIECVPNFSEGRNLETVNAIADAVKQTNGCNVLDVDPGSSTNRTVYTFVGAPEAVVEGALNAAKVAFKLIDMSRHKGEHPRMGALDVCPFIPVKNATMEDCVKCANDFGKRLADELNVPVYLYGYAAKEDKRKLMPSIRAGEYEGMSKKLQDASWKPDFGPATFVPSWGGTVTGARDYLLAYNINLISTKEQAHKIALNIRETGRGNDKPGRLKFVQGIGWYLNEANIAQVSVNITNYHRTPLHVVYEEVKTDAEKLNLPVVGSEIVGLVPLDTLLKAAEFYMKKERLFILEERSKVRLAIDRLGLNSLGVYDPDKKVIEYMIQNDKVDNPLASKTLKDFINVVGSRSPAPGGGSVSATVAALGSALGSMAGLLTYGKKQWEFLDATMRENIPPLFNCTQELIPLIDADSKAFDQYMLALKLPKSSKDETTDRELAMEEGMLQAIRVPLTVMSSANKAWLPLLTIAKHGNIQCVSDVQVGARCLETGIWGAYQNVMINIPNVNKELQANIKEDANKALKFAEEQCKEILQIVELRGNMTF